jgi:hypothetical protein
MFPLSVRLGMVARFALEMAAEPLRFELVRPEIVLLPAAMVLLVSVSAVARPTNVSVVVGRLTVAEPLTRLAAMFPVRVLLVRVAARVSVTTGSTEPL